MPKAAPILLFLAVATFLVISIGKRVFGAYGFSPTTEDAIATLAVAGLACLIWGTKKGP